MSDFLHNLRTGNIKRFDRNRKNYDNPQYRHPQDRHHNKDRKGNYHKKIHTGEQLQDIKKHLELISQTIENNYKAHAKAADALDRIATVLEAATGMQTARANSAAATSPTPIDASTAAPEDPVDAAKTSVDPTQDVLAIITALRADGATFEKIAAELEDRQIPTVSGRGKWRGQAVSKLLKEKTA